MKYDAFISYSHAADGALAPALHAGLHRLARRWLALRALRVFRDQTNLSAAPHLWDSIERALAQSRFLILMASPEAARSEWVARELAWWLSHRKVDRLLIVLTGGRLAWSDAAGDFDWSVTDALPQAMAGRFAAEPKHVDLSPAHRPSQLTLDNPAFRDAVLDLAAPIHGKDKDLLDGEDVRQLRHARLLTRSAMGALATLAIGASAAAWIAVEQRRVAQAERAEAIKQRQVALARQLVAQSSLVLTQSPDRVPLALLLALESLRQHPSFEGHVALRSALHLAPKPLWSSDRASLPLQRSVRAIGFSADGTRMAAGREDGTAELVDVRALKMVAVVGHDDTPGVVRESPGGGIHWKAPGSDAEVVAVAFSHDSRWLATGGRDGTVRVWDAASGRAAHRLPHGGPVTSVAFHPGRAWLATGSEDGQARLWNAADGTLLHAFPCASEAVRDVRFSPDGKWLAMIDSGACAQLIGADDGVSVRRWVVAGSAGLSLGFSPDSTRLATSGGDVVAVVDVASGRPLFQASHDHRLGDGMPAHFKWVDHVVFSPDGARLASAGRDGTVRVWDVAAGQEIARLTHEAGVESVAFGAGGRQLLSASWDGTARVWDIPSGRERLRMGHPGGARAAAFGTGAPLAASGGADGSLVLWQLDQGDRPLAVIHGTQAIEAVAASDDGRRLASVDRQGRLKLWHADGEPLGEVGPFYGPRRLIFSEDARYLAVTGRSPAAGLVDAGALPPTAIELAGGRGADDVVAGATSIVARDRRSGRLLAWQTVGGAMQPVADEARADRLAFDPTGRHLATLHLDVHGKGSLRVRAVAGWRETGRIAVERSHDFALAPDGVRVAVTRSERDDAGSPWRRRIDVLDAASGQRVMTLPDDRPLQSLRFSADGRHLLAVGESADEVRVWRLADAALVARLRHDAEIDRMRIDPSGDVVATGAGRQISIWHIPTGELLGQLRADDRFTDFAFTTRGERLLTGDTSGTLSLWRWRTEDLREEGCRRLTRNLQRDEWTRYVGDAPYRATCPHLPMPAEPAASSAASVAAASQRPR